MHPVFAGGFAFLGGLGGNGFGEALRHLARCAPVGVDQRAARPRRARLDPGLQWRGDPTDLERLVLNLVDNAIRHGKIPEGSRSTVAVRLAAGAGGLALILVPTSLLLDASVRFDEQRHVVPGLLLAMIGIAGAIAVAWQRSTETRRGWWLRT